MKQKVIESDYQLPFQAMLLQQQPVYVHQKKLKIEEEIEFDSHPVDEFYFKTEGKKQHAEVNTLQLNARIMKWQLEKQIYHRAKQRTRSLRKRVRKGIPASMRSIIWKQLVDEKIKKDDYQKLLKQGIDKAKFYQTIILDVHRTYPNNYLFQENCILFRQLIETLVYISLVRPTLGYCQGMNFIVGGLLLIMNQHQTLNMSIIIVDQMKQEYIEPKRVLVWMQVYSTLLKKFMPKVHQHLDQLQIPHELYATEWVITLFSNVIEYQKWLRIMDIYWVEGDKIIYRIMLAIIHFKQQKLMHIQDLGEIVMCIKKLDDINELDNDLFIKTAINFSFSSKELTALKQKAEEEYAARD